MAEDIKNTNLSAEKENDNVSRNLDGVALIKPEFLITEKIHRKESSNEDKKIETKDKKIETEDSKCSDEPPKKKLKGQNKKRPRNARIPKSEKLCMKYISDLKCEYGEKCCFSHDISKFMNDKLPDIGSSCYIYDTYGMCRFGLNCRFGSCHINDKFENKINEDLWKENKTDLTFINTLPRDLQVNLRTRKYDFKRTNDILAILQKQNTKRLNSENNDKVAQEQSTDVKEDKSLLENVGASSGPFIDEDLIKLRKCEVKKVEFKDKLYLAPLTTVGNLPFRRVCKEFGVDITCGEMALCANLLQAQPSEWALLRRHETEDLYGVQVCGAHPDMMTRCAQVIDENVNVDFVDINMGCPIDLVYQKGAGSGLMGKYRKLHDIVHGMSSVLSVPLTIKIRTGIYENKRIAHSLISKLKQSNPDVVSLITLHGRSREQRYTRSADWQYIAECASVADPIPLFGNGDVLSFEDYNLQKKMSGVSGIMIARGALIKPWIFTEIKEQRHWDISSSERFEMMKKYTNYGLHYWGSDTQGVEKTRRFLLEWLSFLYRYIPVGILERVPQKINERPPLYGGRDDLETLMASPNCKDWIKLSEMLLGPVSEDFVFLPKHKANSYS